MTEEAVACGDELTRQSWESMQLRVLVRDCVLAGGKAALKAAGIPLPRKED